ncbi:MAG: cytochrome b [Shewanellaceae bacterium]|nr:cytochrome b [Shewanellaceae bacterium]
MFKNTNASYGIVSIWNHWLGGILFIIILLMGLYMNLLPRSPLKEALQYWHQSLSFFVVLMFLSRFIWKFLSPTPNIIRSFGIWEMYLAKIVHMILFWSLLLMPLSGLVMLQATGESMVLFNAYVIPEIVPISSAWVSVATLFHQYFSYTLVGIIGLHVLGALKHHFIDRDNTFNRILRSERLWFNS